MKKKLLLMLPMLHQGGFERVAVATARLLANDFDVALCIFSDKNIHYDVSGLEIINLNVPSKKSRLRKVCNVILRAYRAARVKKTRAIDITYSFGNTANLVNIFSRGGDRIVTGFRCATDLENPWLVRQCIRRSDLVISCSEEIRALLKRDFACEHAAVVENPLDVADIRKKAGEGEILRKDGTFVLVTMGRDDAIKSHWHMIKAFSLVLKTHPEARLKIIGAGSYENYHRLADDLGVADRIEFTGNLKNPFPEVSAADLYVLPSNREGFPNAMIEAMALGRPVIAADCRTGPREIALSDSEQAALYETVSPGCSIPETIEGTYAVLVPDMSAVIDLDPQHIEDGERVLAEEIVKMIENDARREHYGRQSLLRAESFSPEAYLQKLRRELEER
ncbi:MAG: glycosyltransferase [Lachnospiraceae bacterium]|nr:glycosyltransferase [Lachnospiraceae bacterium]